MHMHTKPWRRVLRTLACVRTLAWPSVVCLAAAEAAGQCESAKFLSTPPPYSPHLLGSSVDVDGDVAIAGAYRRDPDGAAYVYERVAGVWQQTALLLPPEGGSPFDEMEFGAAVAVSGDTAIVGAWRYPDAGQFGAAYVFVRSGTGAWEFQARLTAADGALGDRFGSAVAIEGDTVLVSAIWDDDLGQNSGAVYVFTRSGTLWIQQTKITRPGQPPIGFGVDVAISGDTALIGAEDYNTYRGEAHVFVRDGTQWVHQATLAALDPEENCGFAEDVDIDGDTAVVGAPGRDVFYSGSGAAYVYQRTGTIWTQEIRLTQGVEDSLWYDAFGWSVGVDGDIIALGYPGDDEACPTNPLCESGSVRLFRRVSGQWSAAGELTADDAQQEHEFGLVLALDGDHLIVGVPNDSEGAGGMGAAYLIAGLIPVDCNGNGEPDGCDIAAGMSTDLNGNGVPDECDPAVPGDINGDGVVNVDDLLAVIAAWGPCPAPPSACPADTDDSGVVDVDDLLTVLMNWS